jgi:hypothetical protein
LGVAMFAGILRASFLLSSLAVKLKKAECRRCAAARRVVSTHQIEFGKFGRLRNRASATEILKAITSTSVIGHLPLESMSLDCPGKGYRTVFTRLPWIKQASNSSTDHGGGGKRRGLLIGGALKFGRAALVRYSAPGGARQRCVTARCVARAQERRSGAHGCGGALPGAAARKLLKHQCFQLARSVRHTASGARASLSADFMSR